MRQQIVVAGGDLADDPIAKGVLEYGFQPVFYDKRSNTGIALTKGAIVKTNFCSHDLMWQVKSTYQSKNLPLFFAKGGFSHIKEEFEKKFVVPVKKDLSKLNKRRELIYILATFYNHGEKFKVADLVTLLNIYANDLSSGYVSVLLHSLADEGVILKTEHGKYRWLGMTSKTELSKMQVEVGRPLSDAIFMKPAIVEIVTPESPRIETSTEVPQERASSNTLFDSTPAQKQPYSMHELHKKMDDMNTRIDKLVGVLDVILKIGEVNKIMERK